MDIDDFTLKNERHADGSFRLALYVSGVKFVSEPFTTPREVGEAKIKIQDTIRNIVA